ncbi:interferon-activable protein 204-like, partial [Grammomys surdaster]|uniref:interferon-activable protein 204-like n=1 Tax=Grammomys surdaster TaxID=491861 RepID=UPI00109EEA28
TPRRGTVPNEPSNEVGHHQGPKQVMVLKVTEPFTYDMKEDKRMFHATVATETEFFRVKVFDTALKSKFIPRKIIAISDYYGCNGFLEIYRPSCVSDVNANQRMVISSTLRQRANATPKISYLFSQTRGTFVNGEFAVIKKTERNKFIYYGIEDDTGKMEVVVYGRLTNINCEPGNKLRLVCFELTSTEDTWQLRSVRHSYMQRIMNRNHKFLQMPRENRQQGVAINLQPKKACAKNTPHHSVIIFVINARR